MHKDWCGKPCSECQNPCELDKSIPCSPDCECLGANGERDCPECKQCDAALPEKEFQVHISYDGIVVVRAVSEEAARDFVGELTCDEMYKLSDGTWDIDDIEEMDGDE